VVKLWLVEFTNSRETIHWLNRLELGCGVDGDTLPYSMLK